MLWRNKHSVNEGASALSYKVQMRDTNICVTYCLLIAVESVRSRAAIWDRQLVSLLANIIDRMTNETSRL